MAHVPRLSPRALRRIGGALNALGLLLLMFFLGVGAGLTAQADEYCSTSPPSSTLWHAANSFFRGAPYNVSGYQNPSSALQAGRAAQDAWDTAREYVPGYDTAMSCSGSPVQCSFNFRMCSNGSTTSGCNGFAFVVQEQAGTSCTPKPPVDCTGLANKTMVYGTSSSQPLTYEPPTELCYDDCAAFRKIQKTSGEPMKWFRQRDTSTTASYQAVYQFTGLNCDAEPAADVNEVVQAGERCSGSFCQSPQSGENCGFLNDKYVCVEQLEPDKCYKNEDGSTLCADSAPMPPKPDNGTAGVPATPTSSVEACTGANSCTTTNYYNTTTTSGSSRPVPNGSGPSGSGTVDGQGPADGEGQESSGSASGGTTCAAAPVCQGDAIACAQLEQSWRARCHLDGDASQEGVLAAMGATTAEREGDLSHGQVGLDVSTMLNADGGYAAPACPAPLNVSMFGQSMSFDLWAYACQFALAFAPFTMVMGYLSAASILVKGIRK